MCFNRNINGNKDFWCVIIVYCVTVRETLVNKVIFMKAVFAHIEAAIL